MDALLSRAGQSIWCPNAYLTEQHIHPVSALIHWQIGEKQPWCLATNLPDASLTLRYYRRRMWTEEMFGSFPLAPGAFVLVCAISSIVRIVVI